MEITPILSKRVKKVFKKLAQKLSLDRQKYSGVTTNPIKNVFLNKLTKNTIDMYERNCDIKNFSKLVLSNPENDSHNKIVDKLFSNGVIDPFEDEKLLKLSDNTKFLRELGLLDD